MAENALQNLENHTRRVPVYLAVIGIFVLNLVWAVIRLVKYPAMDTVMAVLMATAFILLSLYSRRFTLTVQDRLIRLEMRLRMKELLPADLQNRIGEFTLRQLVALRFASDEELPGLCRTVLADKISDGKAIKQMIKHWQADHLRA
jgi:hypothetical protein